MPDIAVPETSEQKPAEYNAVAARNRAGLLSQELTEKLFGDAISGAIEPREAIRLLELLSKTAGAFDEKPQVVVQNTAAEFKLPLPHIGKVAHCFGEEKVEAQADV